MKYACSTDGGCKDQLPSTKGLAMIAILRLRRRQSALRAEHARRDRRELHAGARRRRALRARRKIILPGVGHFGQMMRSLDAMRVRPALASSASARACRSSASASGCRRCSSAAKKRPKSRASAFSRRQSSASRRTRACRTWAGTTLDLSEPARLLRGIAPEPYVYFAHSYYVPVIDATAATCTYARSLHALLEQDNVFGVQFHPEKSGPLGLQIVRNFVEL